MLELIENHTGALTQVHGIHRRVGPAQDSAIMPTVLIFDRFRLAMPKPPS